MKTTQTRDSALYDAQAFFEQFIKAKNDFFKREIFININIDELYPPYSSIVYRILKTVINKHYKRQGGKYRYSIKESSLSMTREDFISDFAIEYDTFKLQLKGYAKKAKAKKPLFNKIPVKVVEKIEPVAIPTVKMETPAELLTKTNALLEKMIAFQEENRCVLKHSVENDLAFQSRLLRELSDIRNLIE